MASKAPLDQFGTFEVFVEPRQGKPFQHEGAVHAPDIELAFVLAKEAFTRRFTCSSMFVVETRHIWVSEMTEGEVSVYDVFGENVLEAHGGEMESYEIFHLLKRGKQHVHAGRLQALSYHHAFYEAKRIFKPSQVVYNIWVVKTGGIRFTSPEEKDFWVTLPEKKFRDASAYKAGDKLKNFLDKKQLWKKK